MKPISVCGLLFAVLLAGVLLGTWQQQRKDETEFRADAALLASAHADLGAATAADRAAEAELARWRGMFPRQPQTPAEFKAALLQSQQTSDAQIRQNYQGIQHELGLLNACQIEQQQIDAARQAQQSQGPQAALALLAKLLLR